MNWPMTAAIASMWIGSGIGAYGAAATSGAPLFYIGAAICTYFVLVYMAGKGEKP